MIYSSFYPLRRLNGGIDNYKDLDVKDPLRYMNMVNGMCLKLIPMTYRDREDMRQDIWVSVMKAIRKIDENIGVTAYILSTIRFEVYRCFWHVANGKYKTHPVSLDNKSDLCESMSGCSYVENGFSSVQHSEDLKVMFDIIKDVRYFDIFKQLADGLSFVDIAKKLKISKQAVNLRFNVFKRQARVKLINSGYMKRV